MIAVATGAALAALAGGNAWAYDPLRPLGQVTGLTELQQRTGDAVQAVCGGFINGGVDEQRDDADQQRILFDKCGEMVNTANRLRGEGGTAKDLGIGAEQLGAALQNVSTEEIAAAGSLVTESSSQQGSAVARRLASVLSQSSSLQVSSASLLGDTRLVALQPASIGVPSGGAAADDAGIVNRLGVYVNALGAFAEKTTTDGEDGFEANSAGLSVGVDYLFSDNFLAGINLGFVNTTTDFTVTSDVSGGDMDSSQFNGSAYGLWFGDAGYVDLVAGFGTGSFDLQRSIVIGSGADAAEPDTGNPNDGADDVAFGETDSSSFRFGVGGGLEINSGPLMFAPYARLSYLQVELDGYEETGGSALALRVEDQSIDSLTAGFGVRLVGTYSGSRAVLSPQLSLEMVQELMDDSRQIVSTYLHDPRSLPLVIVTDEPDRTYYSVGFGLAAVFTNGVQVFGEARSLMDLDDLNEFALSSGVRFEF